MFSCPPNEVSQQRIRTSKSARWSWPKFVSLQDAEERSPARQGGVSEPNPSSTMHPEEDAQPARLSEPSPPSPASYFVVRKSTQAPQAEKQSGSGMNGDANTTVERDSINSKAQSETVQKAADAPGEDRAIPSLVYETHETQEDNERKPNRTKTATTSLVAGQNPISAEPMSGCAVEPRKSHEPAGGLEPSTIPRIQVQTPTPAPSEAEPKVVHPEGARADPTATQVSIGASNEAAVGTGSQREPSSELVVVIPRPTQTRMEANESPARLKRRRKLLRRARNVLNRRTYLKVTLGRKLAFPVKDILRRSAMDEDVDIVEIQVVT